MKKSGQATVPPSFRLVRTGGQVPTRDNIEALRMAQRPAPEFNAAMLMQHTDPVMRVEGIVKGLGLDVARESSWKKFLEDQLNGGTNELVMRKALYQRMMGERMEPELRKAIFQRSMSYYKEKMRKSLVQIVTADEILEKAEARGGSYHRRVPAKGGKGYRYIYDEEKYNTREDAHLSGVDAKSMRIQKAVTGMVTAAEKGCSVEEMKALSKKFGSKEVASVLKKQCSEGGTLQYKGGKFSVKKSPEMKKSLDPDFKFVIGSRE